MFLDRKWIEARKTEVKTTFGWWLSWKRTNDEVPRDLWRVRDAYYDFERFQHPGGKTWMDITKGTDITELFESSHLNIEKANKYLKTYRVSNRKPDKPRASPMTFRKDGFYCTLRRNAHKALMRRSGGWGPSVSIRILSDFLVLIFVTCFTMCIYRESYVWAVLAGFTLAHCCGMAHNFFHQRDNWRMYAFDLSLLSSFEWRVSHCYSHHCYPNQIKDAEVIGLEPFYLFLPDNDATDRKRGGFNIRWIATIIFSHLLNATIFHGMLVYRFVEVLIFGRQKLRVENLIPLIQLSVLFSTCENGILIWNIIHASASWWFITMSLIGGTHHHPDVWHDGEKQFEKNKDFDFGICQLRAVIDRPDVNSTLFTSSTMFGDHALHHLFPTVDASRLYILRDVLKQTCLDFGLDVTVRTCTFERDIRGTLHLFFFFRSRSEFLLELPQTRGTPTLGTQQQIHKKASFWECCKGFYRNLLV